MQLPGLRPHGLSKHLSNKEYYKRFYAMATTKSHVHTIQGCNADIISGNQDYAESIVQVVPSVSLGQDPVPFTRIMFQQWSPGCDIGPDHQYPNAYSITDKVLCNAVLQHHQYPHLLPMAFNAYFQQYDSVRWSSVWLMEVSSVVTCLAANCLVHALILSNEFV